ncbi:hypothetical protein PV325_001149 [Microctonus aethiopoides]|uniref:Epimerase family protein SDR39U1 n=1 Tax=Microctonus aethiopoides TaxID=144406 RepID=A0AA39C5W0_9HYME|nr:hypothetical protein PV325_001149 [Microctonus aethiopoides]KAK0158179.1 hypothetical protein PV328_009214 [Microctonus aethiopoides]
MVVKRVVIGGGSGFIGSALSYALRNQGIEVTIISRIQRSNGITWEHLAKDGLPDDTTHVINVAGQNILDPTKRWTKEFKKIVWDSRVRTTRSLARAVANSDVKFFATVSGVAYYKPNDEEYTEYDKCEKYDFLSELTHAWEEAAELPNDNKCRRVTIRSGVVLGRNGGMISQIFMPFYFGLGGPMGTGKQYLPWIHISDIVDLFIFASEKENVTGILNGVAPEIITNKQFTKAFSRALWKPAFIPMPSFALNLLFSSERAKIILEGQKVIPKRVLEYGFEYKYPNIKIACEQFSELVYSGVY